MGKIIYDPKKDTFTTDWERMELRKNGSTVWIDGIPHEISIEESARLLFQQTAQDPHKRKKFIKHFNSLIKDCIKEFGLKDTLEGFRMILGKDFDIEQEEKDG